MRIASFNVNSIKARLPILLAWLQRAQIDAVVLQETKTEDDAFPLAAIQEAGYEAFYFGQKSYNGVALLARRDAFPAMQEVARNIPCYPDSSARSIAVRLTAVADTPFLFIGAYFPNGQEVGSEKYLYKLDWIAAMTRWVRELRKDGVSIVLAGDMNIAPTDDDVWDPEGWKGNLLVSVPERDAFQGLLRAGLVDPRARLHPGERSYSWWDYRFQSFEKNHGLRIDHILASPDLATRFTVLEVDRSPRSLERPSDHAPLVATLTQSA